VALVIPSDWGNYSAADKIDFFNANDVTPAELQAADPTLTGDGLAWMRANGYAVVDEPIEPPPRAYQPEPIYYLEDELALERERYWAELRELREQAERAEAERLAAFAELQRQAQAALAEAERQRQAALAEAERQRQAALAEAERQRQAELAEQARLAALAEAERQRQAELAEQARLAALVEAERQRQVELAEQARLAALAEAARLAALAEAARLKALAEAEARRQAELAEQARLAALAEAEARRQAELAEIARLAAIAQAEEARLAAIAQAERERQEALNALPRFVVASIQNAAAGSVNDKIDWLIDQRSIMSDEEARRRAELVLGDQADDAWETLQRLASEAQTERAALAEAERQRQAELAEQARLAALAEAARLEAEAARLEAEAAALAEAARLEQSLALEGTEQTIMTTSDLPNFVVAAIRNAAAGDLDAKIAWLNSQRSIMSDDEARARAEAVLGDIPDDDWAQLQSYATAQAALDAEAKARAQQQPVYGAPAGWRYSLITGELVPIDASIDELVALQTDQGLTAEQEQAEIRREIIIQVSQLNLDEKINFVNRELELQSASDLRAEIEAVLGKQDDAAWATLTSMAAQESAPVILSPPLTPSTPTGASIMETPAPKPFIAPVAQPPSVSQGNTMERTIGTKTLPANWDELNASQKITWFNINQITPGQLKAAGVSDADIAWMQSNGYIVGSTAAAPAAAPGGINPLLIAAAAALLLGS